MDNDEDIPCLLQEWGLSQYIAVFKANNITLETLSLLDNFLVKELITPIGDRARFLKNLQNWKTITKTHDSELYMSTSTSDEFVDILNPTHKNLSVSDFLNPPNALSEDIELRKTPTPTPTNNTSILSTENVSGTDYEDSIMYFAIEIPIDEIK